MEGHSRCLAMLQQVVIGKNTVDGTVKFQRCSGSIEEEVRVSVSEK